MSIERFYKFSSAELKEVVAHGGAGQIRTARVEGGERHGAFNFIDLTEIPPAASVGVHTHGLNEEEAYVIISGKGRMLSQGKRFEVGPGDVIVNSPGGTHALENTGKDPLRVVVLEVPARN
jgi:mannose-6-phosphate isomerase-like protein (cupin superfamily)